RAGMSPTTGLAGRRRRSHSLAAILGALQAGTVLLALAGLCACGIAVHSASSPHPPQPAAAPRPAAAQPGRGCQDAFVPSYFYSGSGWIRAIDTGPAPGVMLLNVDN